MDAQLEKDRAALRPPPRFMQQGGAVPSRTSSVPAPHGDKPATKKKSTKAGTKPSAKASSSGLGSSVKRSSTRGPTATGGLRKAGGATKPTDPMALAKHEIAALTKELKKERDTSQARIDNLTKEANTRMDEYEILIGKLQRENAEKERTIRDKIDEIVKIERARDARYKQYEQYIGDGEKVRAELLNNLIELKGNIRVFCRVRPILSRDTVNTAADASDHFDFPEFTDHRVVEVKDVPGHAGIMGKKEDAIKTMQFTFDRVFDKQSTNPQVFDDISQLVQSALDGYRVCVFAYGQTGSGKTFTMEGPDPGVSSDRSGMIPRAVRQIFENCEWKTRQTGFRFRLLCSFVQIYNDNIHDLMNSPNDYLTGPGRDPIKHEIRNTETETIITNVKEEEVTDEKTVFKLLQRAADNRKVSGHNLNEVSSRSHSVFIMKIKGVNEATQQEMMGQLNLIDLAGSERLAKSGSEGDRLKETQHINKSLACLGDVIMGLGKGDKAVPFRQSKLTHLLQPSMTGQSKMLMFVNINPMGEHLQESLCSLRFAAKVNACEIGLAKKRVTSK